MTDISVTQVFKVRAWEKLRERKNNYSGAEKDAVVTMTHQTGGQIQLFSFQHQKRQEIRRLHINTVVAKNVSSWGSNPAV